MASVSDMVAREVGIFTQGCLIRHIIGCTGNGQDCLDNRETELQPLSARDMIFLRADHQVLWWVSSNKPEGLIDLLVVFEDATTSTEPAGVSEGGGGDGGNAAGAGGDNGDTAIGGELG